jgi:1-acyl-sn-glycerol-3-phosphate acyltransferase
VASWLVADPLWSAALAVAEVVLRIPYRYRPVGLHRIPPRGPAILASNHVSPMDPVVLGFAVSHRLRRIRYLTAAEFFAWPGVGLLLRGMGMVPVRRGAGDRSAYPAAAAALRRGELIGIFPEGRLGDGGALLPAHPGTARIALQNHVSIVPIAVWGAQRRWPRGGIRLHPPLRPVVTIAAGEPIVPVGDAGSSGDVERLTGQVMDAIARLVAAADGADGRRT